jgi:hypothetical protein
MATAMPAASTDLHLLTKTEIFGSGKEVFAIEFRHGETGTLMRTSWTTYRAQALLWGRNIQQTGWSAEGRPEAVV